MELPDTSDQTLNCTTASADVSAADLQYFLDSAPKYRSFKTADRIAASYVDCAGTSPVAQMLEEGSGSSYASCAGLLTEKVAANILSSVLLSDPVRTVLHSTAYLKCAQNLELSESFSGRIYLATSATGLAPIVSKDTSACAAEAIQGSDAQASVESLLKGASDPAAAAALATALASCADTVLLAELLAVTSGSQPDCVLDLLSSSRAEAADVLSSYILQDEKSGAEALQVVKNRCLAENPN